MAVIEDKAPWYLPNGDMVQMWNEDKILTEMINPNPVRCSVKDVIEHIYGYLSFNRLRYGMLTCYDVTYFVSRPAAGLLMISDPIVFDSTEPTLLECIYYFADLVEKSSSSTEVSSSDTDQPPHDSPDGPPLPSPDDKDDSDYGPKPKRRKCDNKSAENKISHITPKNIQDRQFIAEGASGQVYLLPNEIQAIKVCDTFNNRDGHKMLLHEIEVYKHLQKFDLDFVPRYYFDEDVYGQHFLVIEFVPGKPCNWRDSEHELKVKSCLERLRECGVKHRDLRPDNVLLGDDGKIWIIDFGKSDLLQ
eukprot:Partr_v1_DN26542_c0_g1_i5_m3454